MKKSTKVFVLLYDHKFGTDCWVFGKRTDGKKARKNIERDPDFKASQDTWTPERVELLEKEIE